VIEYLDSHSSEKITLRKLSTFTGLCPNHLQETFKRIVGVSPKAFCDARRLTHFKQLLKKGESISTAIYRAGYESSRAIYERSRKCMGMTPATYQRGGEGVTICYSLMDATLGRTLLARTENGICAILIGDDDKLLFGRLHGEFPKAVFTQDTVTPGKWIAATQSCQSEDPLISKLPESLRKQVFEVKLWKALR